MRFGNIHCWKADHLDPISDEAAFAAAMLAPPVIGGLGAQGRAADRVAAQLAIAEAEAKDAEKAKGKGRKGNKREKVKGAGNTKDKRAEVKGRSGKRKPVRSM